MGIVKSLRGGWAFSAASSTDLAFFGFSHCWVFFGFSVDAFFGCEFHLYFVVVLSTLALGAGIRPGVFGPTGSTASTMGWTGWKFVAAISLRMRAIFVLIASAFTLS